MEELPKGKSLCASVVIPAYNEARWIAVTLGAVLAQSPRQGAFEVIVVDADSSDDTCRIAETFPVTVTRSGQRMSYVARNLGYARSVADHVVFLDADCVPAPGWLEAMLDAAAQGGDYVAGCIENVVAVDNMANRVLALRTSADARKAAAMEGKVAAGNMMVKRAVFERIGPFEAVASGADIRQSAKALAQGFDLAYAPDAIVRHQCDLGVLDYLRRRYRIKRGQAAAAPDRRHRLLTLTVQMLRPGLGEAMRMSRVLGKPWMAVWPMLWAERWAELLGWAAGALAVRPDPGSNVAEDHA